MALVGDDTDRAWEQLGREDPYFGVLTDPRFHADRLDAAALEEFFASGEHHVARLFAVIEATLAPGFAPRRALDFGCGVGRILLPLARRSASVVGVDVSPSMLERARQNAAERGAGNVELVVGDDALTQLSGGFDLVHSFIVLQHVPSARGLELVARLLERLEPGGVAVLHVLYASRRRWPSRAAGWLRARVPLVHRLLNLREGRPLDRPHMQMNRYDLNRLFDLLQRSGCHDCHVRFSDHFGHQGVLLFARRVEQPGF